MLKQGLWLSYLPLPFCLILEGIYEVKFAYILLLFFLGFYFQVRYGRIFTVLFALLCNCFISLGLSYLFFETIPPLGDSLLVYLKQPITVDILATRYYSFGIEIFSYFSGLLYGFLAVCLYLKKKWYS